MSSRIYLLHGWGCDSSSWQPIIPFLEKYFQVCTIDLPGFGSAQPLAQFNLEAVLNYLAEKIDQPGMLLGWSLGAMLGVQFAARYPQKISALICLAANQKFVANDDYPAAMPIAINKNFNGTFAKHPEQTLKLFSGLVVQGDNNDRSLRKQMRELFNAEKINHNWLEALELLSLLDNRTSLQQLTQPCLHLLAEKDALVPVSCKNLYSNLNANHITQVFADVGHALHWSQPQLVSETIIDWWQNKNSILFKKRVAQSFSRAAITYDQAASLQREVGEKLLNLFKSSEQVEQVLDLGCGTGYFLPHLQLKFSNAHLIAADMAEAMLIAAQKNQPCDAICTDAEHLPFANQIFDRIYANFSLQWCSQLDVLFSEILRVLRERGEIVFSTLGEDSLHELKSAWRQVDDQVHVNRFLKTTDWQLAIQKKLSIESFDVERHTLYFPDFKSLAKSLKMLGAHNLNSGRPQGLTGRKKLAALECAYEAYRVPQGLPLTYDVIYCRAQRL